MKSRIAGYIIGFMLAAGASAQTVPAFTIDMTTVIYDENKQPLPESIGGPTLGHMVARSLLQVDASATPADLWARAILADKLKDDKAATLTHEQAVLVEKMFVKLYPAPVIVAQVWPLLGEPKPSAER